MAKVILYEDTMQVVEVDPDGKRFDKVSRLRCRGDNWETDLSVDINVDIYPLKVNDKFAFMLSATLAEDGTPDDGTYDQSQNKKSLMDKFDYVMHGKVFKIGEDRSSTPPKMEVYGSFGGLLMLLKGEPAGLKDLDVDMRVYLLARKI